MLHKHSEKYRNPRLLVHRSKTAELELPETKLLSTQFQTLTNDKTTPTSTSIQETKQLGQRYTIPEHGIKEDVAYSLIHNELTLDGNPHLNLASFVNTATTDIAKKLVMENINKNLADNDEYPQLIELTQRCVSILAQLWCCSKGDTPIGCSTTGSSEAVMLGGLTMKKRWEHKMRAQGRDCSKPNIIMSSACQVALEKFARYFDVECRLVPVSAATHFCMDPKLLHEYVDENTIGLFVIMGTTYTGHLEDISEICRTLEEIESRNPQWGNLEIPIHVDGASGGFILPFGYDAEHLSKLNGLDQWCFNNPRVLSINTSSHKFGLTTPGLGWVLWRDESLLPAELRFRLKYLGGVEETFGLNFSRPGFQVVHQYFNFMSLGFTGFRERFRKSLFVARAFSYALLKSEKLRDSIEIVSSVHERIADGGVPQNVNEYISQFDAFKAGIPLVAFKLSRKFQEKYPDIPQVIVSSMLRTRGWIIPNYPLPRSTDGSEKWEVLRVVFRSEMQLDLAQLLLFDIETVIARLVRSYEKVLRHLAAEQTEEERRAFIYEMLLTLASPGGPDAAASDDEDAENAEAAARAREKRAHLAERTSRNYRGTC
ncbi:glutamate decarboxylase GAD1 KNAG_0J00520 [Huiozyma naganishii CBS 8797]|uniref:Glutamate decarboxylase n=1 Tax=Huiozyma naganishii (strain ATCC MYA-139 / BCRC 22969 / CBS 8797 / KCTC 17520 / NBRC 10181 / NCYC 3082 / Yp74L-3) TaxID=1071383 RepID=J7RB82_HUIN7|nr:hypothetical protein KNAG_0J00520 [Kazachstania naganishii CBS 8797]CCK72135.1 hypothetical protein KNAG_0J00520 [Kazachstania naganishii CBS 8797]